MNKKLVFSRDGDIKYGDEVVGSWGRIGMVSYHFRPSPYQGQYNAFYKDQHLIYSTKKALREYIEKDLGISNGCNNK